MNSKYTPLESHLRASGQARVRMTFRQIEDVIGTGLPPSAFRHRSLWSNNPGNWVMTRAWLAAGYRTERVDVQERRLVFRKADQRPSPPDTGRGASEGLDRGGSSASVPPGSFARVFGALKQTITIAPGTDLTEPAGGEWDAAR